MTMDNFRAEDMPHSGITRASEFGGDDGVGENPPPAITQVEERPYPLPEIAATSTPGNVDEDGQQILEDGFGVGDAMAQTQSSDKVLPEGEAEHLDTFSSLAEKVRPSGDRLGYNEHDVLHEGETVDTAPGNPDNPAIPANHPVAGDAQQGDIVPTGSANDVLEWVGDDKVRAQRALDRETESGSPRKGLTAKLNEVLADNEESDSE